MLHGYRPSRKLNHKYQLLVKSNTQIRIKTSLRFAGHFKYIDNEETWIQRNQETLILIGLQINKFL